MSRHPYRHRIPTALVAALALGTLSSCTVRPSPLLEGTSAHPDNLSNPERNGSAATETLERTDLGWSIVPADGWQILGDPTDSALHVLEFWNPQFSIRAELTVALGAYGTSAAMDQARTEATARSSGLLQGAPADPVAWNGPQGSGWMWQFSGEKGSLRRQDLGVVIPLKDRLVLLAVSSQDSLRPPEVMEALLQEAFRGLVLLVGTGEDTQRPNWEAATPLQSHVYGYAVSVPGDGWKRNLGFERTNPEAEYAFADTAQNLNLAVFPVLFGSDGLSEDEALSSLLMRQGIDPAPILDGKSRRGAFDSTAGFSFDATRDRDDKAYSCRGTWWWQAGRGILALAWTGPDGDRTQLPHIVEAIHPGPVPTASLSLVRDRRNARVWNMTGMRKLLEDQPLIALTMFERANRLDPNEPMYLVNCGFVYQLKNLHGPGITHFLDSYALVKNNGKLLAILGEMEEEVGDYQNAALHNRMALSYQPGDQETAINLSDDLWALGQRNQSLEVVQRLYGRQPSQRLAVYISRTLIGMEQYSEAVDLLYGAKERFGLSRDLGNALCEALIDLERYSEVLAIANELLLQKDSKGDIQATWRLKGKSEFFLQRFRNAESSLARALELDPRDEDAKSFLSATRGFLGKSDTRVLQTPIEPVWKRPADLRTLLHPETADSAHAQGFPAVIHYQSEALAQKNNRWIRTETILLQLLDSRGPAQYQEFVYPFLPGYDRVHVNALDLLDPDLKVKARFQPKRAYITQSTEEGTKAETQLAHLPLPEGAKAGDFVFVQVSHTSISEDGTIPFSHHVASRNVPVGTDVLEVLADTNKLLAEDYGPVRKEGFAGGWRWITEDPVVLRSETYLPLYRDYGAGVLVAPKQSWEEVGQEYGRLIQAQFKSPIPVREKAQEIQGGKPWPDTTTLFGIADWVRHNIRYRPVEFGGHSLIPQTALETFTLHKGDCKDQSLLLVEMLAAVGIRANLALINLDEAGSEALPTIQQFNHMIVYVPSGPRLPEVWIDPSDKAGNRRPIALDLEGRVALILDGDKSHVVFTPVLEKDQEHRGTLQHFLYVDTNGSAQFRDNLSLEGKFASGLRNQLLALDSKEQERWMSEWLEQNLPGAMLTNFSVKNLDAYQKPLVLQLSYNCPRYFAASPSGGFAARYPNIWERAFLKLPQTTRRFLPIRLPHETIFASSLQVKTAPGLHIQIEAAPDAAVSPSYARLEETPSATEFRWNFGTYAAFAEPTEYSQIRKDWNYITEKTSPLVEIRP